MIKVAVVGSNGFVGSEICNEIRKLGSYSLIPVTRNDNLQKAVHMADVVIHAANPAKRFFAEQHPEKDFIASVEKTSVIRDLCRSKRLILISSISARTQLDSVYGRNRRSCELIVHSDNNSIVRLGPMYGAGKSIGALNDIINNRKVYVAATTEYAFVDVAYNAKKIVSLISNNDNKGIIEIGAKAGLCLESLRSILNSTSTFEGADDTQIPLKPADDAPDVNDVILFAKSVMK